MFALKLLAVALLLFIAWQDFKFRAVYWWLFVVLLVVLGTIKSMGLHHEIMLLDLFHNCAFLGLQLLCLTVYFSLKERKWVNIFHRYLGLGDLFFLLCIASYFSLLNYILFYMVSLFAVIIVSFLMQFYLSSATDKIPLAGKQAILFIPIILLDLFGPAVKLTTDLWLVNYL